jgi:integrase
MSEEIKVRVVEFSDRKFYMMQWRDPLTGKKQTLSTKVPRTGRKKDRDKAERAAGEHETALREGRYKPPSKVTWGEFRERYEGEVLSGLADGTFTKVSAVFNTLETTLNLGDDARLAAVPDRIGAYQAELRRLGRSEDTIRGHLAHLKAALRWAADANLLTAAPKIRMPPRAKGGAKAMKGRPITTEEFERMLAKVETVLATPTSRKERPEGRKPRSPEVREKMAQAQRQRGRDAAPSWQHLLRGLWLSGLRIGEALELYWDRSDRLCVDFTGRRPMLRIPAELEKGHKDRTLPMTPDFAEFLLATPEADRTGPVFRPTSLSGAERPSFNAVVKIIGAFGKAAHVVVDTHPTTGKVKWASAHDLRRSFGERWSQRVMPQVLMELMRHETIETTMRFYVGRNAERTADAVWEAFSAAKGNTPGNTSASGEVSEETTANENRCSKPH